MLSVREHFKKDTYSAVFLFVAEDLIISSRGSIEKLYKSNIVCVNKTHESKSRYPCLYSKEQLFGA